MKHFFKHFAVAALILFLLGRCVFYSVQCPNGFGADLLESQCDDNPWSPFD